jgi:arginine deiminase
MRATRYKWWCPRGHGNDGNNRFCYQCGHDKVEIHAQVHTRDRAVIFYNTKTGEHRTPARADQPIPEVYRAQGFERKEILSMIEWEKQSGVVHEASNFNAGNETISVEPTLPRPDAKIVHELAKDIADAAASGPWTGADKLV